VGGFRYYVVEQAVFPWFRNDAERRQRTA